MSTSCDGGNGRGDGRNDYLAGKRLWLIAGNSFDKLRGSMDLHGFTTNRPEWLHGVQRQFMRLPFSSSRRAICGGMQRNAPADAADAGPRGPILASPGGSVKGGQKSHTVPKESRHSALHLPTLHRLKIVEINAPSCISKPRASRRLRCV